MSNFTPKVKYTTEFEGDKVECLIRRLKKKHLFKLMPFAPKPGENMSTDQMIGFMDELGGHLTEYVEISGLKDAEDSPLSMEDILDESYFIDLLMDICAQLLTVSLVGKLKPSPSKGRRPAQRKVTV